MTPARPLSLGCALLAATLGFTVSAAAQTNDEIFPQFQWNFSTPGARANGMGRTFIGVADDATATVTNPAGLVSLTKRQIYAEYKNSSIKVDRLADVSSWLSAAHTPTEFSKNVSSISFFNVSSPINNRLAVGVTYHEFLNYKEDFQLAARTIPDISNPGTPITVNGLGFAANPVQGSASFRGTSIAGSVGYALNQNVQVGATLSVNHLSATATATRLGIDFLPGFPSTNPLAVASNPIVKNQTSIDDSGNALGAVLGVLVKPNENVSVGFNYTKSPHFSLSENFLVNPGFVGSPCCGTQQALVTASGFPTNISINVPDHFGVGIAVRPNAKLLVGVDIVRVNYSSLAKDFTIILDSGTVTADKFSVDDATEFHVGAEYNILTGKTPVFVRAGLYTNPNHTIRFDPSLSDRVSNSFENAVYNLLPRDTEVKGTVGAGVAIGPRAQLDVAYIWKKEFVASMAVRF